MCAWRTLSPVFVFSFDLICLSMRGNVTTPKQESTVQSIYVIFRWLLLAMDATKCDASLSFFAMLLLTTRWFP